MRMINSNNDVFKWSSDRNIGSRNVAPLLRQNLTEVNIVQHHPTFSNMLFVVSNMLFVVATL